MRSIKKMGVTLLLFQALCFLVEIQGESKQAELQVATAVQLPTQSAVPQIPTTPIQTPTETKPAEAPLLGQATTTTAISSEPKASSEPPSTGQTQSAISEQKATTGIAVKNNTQYPTTITLHITPANRIIQKDVPSKQTIALLTEPLASTDTYLVSGSLFKSVTTKTTITVLSSLPLDKKPKEFINTQVHRIASSKNWSSTNPTVPNVELTLELIEAPGAEPLFEIRPITTQGTP